MNLENFPTNETAQRIMEMVSPIYDKSYAAKWLYQVIGTELGTATEIVTALLNEVFPETATYTLAWWAALYNISIQSSTDIEEIRKKILLKRNNKRPINPARIEQQIGDMTGHTVSVKENTAPHTYEIVIANEDTPIDMDSVIATVKELKQSNKHVDVVFGSQLSVRIRAEPDIPGTLFPYVLAGTKPDINTAGAVAAVNLLAESDYTETVAVLPVSGPHKVGTIPGISTVGNLENKGLATEITTDSQPVAFKVCGAHTLGKGG